MSWDAAMGALNAACLGVFGRQVLYRPVGGNPIVVTGILETGVRLEENAPGIYALLFLRATDLSSPPERGDEVEIDGATYKVFEVEADAGGGVKLALRIR
jgi:hypothetical protein